MHNERSLNYKKWVGWVSLIFKYYMYVRTKQRKLCRLQRWVGWVLTDSQIHVVHIKQRNLFWSQKVGEYYSLIFKCIWEVSENDSRQKMFSSKIWSQLGPVCSFSLQRKNQIVSLKSGHLCNDSSDFEQTTYNGLVVKSFGFQRCPKSERNRSNAIFYDPLYSLNGLA